MIALWFLSFLLGLCVDLFYVLWMKAVAHDYRWRAVFWSVSISICGLFGFMNAVDDRWLSVPYIIGLGTGTYLGMVLEKKKSE